jgi:hypothetical protein
METLMDALGLDNLAWVIMPTFMQDVFTNSHQFYYVWSGLPEGIFLYQKSQLGYIF